jgi:hypothetical protein
LTTPGTPSLLNVSEDSTVPQAGGTSETSLVGEFRISESADSVWSINADFIISQNTDTSWQTDLLDVVVTDHIGTHNINDSFNNDTGFSKIFVEAATTISRDAQGNLSFSETVPIINTLGDTWNTVSFDDAVTIGDKNLEAGKYRVNDYVEGDGTSYMVLDKLVEGYPSGYFAIQESGSEYFSEVSNATSFNIFVDAINNEMFSVSDSKFQYEALADGTINGATLDSANLYYEMADGTKSSEYVPNGNYLVNIDSQSVILTAIDGDADYDNIPESNTTNSFKLYVNHSDYVNSVSEFEYYINNYDDGYIYPKPCKTSHPPLHNH